MPCVARAAPAMMYAPSRPADLRRTARRLRVSGIAVLVLGLLAATAIYVEAKPPADGEIDNREAFELARIGGTASVRTVEFDHWLSSLFHGERLAWTVAVLSLVACGACLRIAGLMAEDVHVEPGQ